MATRATTNTADDDEYSSDEDDVEGDLDEPATLPGAMAVRHGGRPRLLPIALLGLFWASAYRPPRSCRRALRPGLCHGHAYHAHDHADISTGNRRRLWPSAPIHHPYRLCLTVPDGR